MRKEEIIFLDSLSKNTLEKNIEILINKNRIISLKNKFINEIYSINELRKLTSNVKVYGNLINEIEQRIWHVYNKIDINPICEICGSPSKFLTVLTGYHKLCNKIECSKKSRLLNAEKTCNERYGSKNPSNIKIFQEKRTNTFIKKYGVENPWQSEEVKEKIKETNKKLYGVENASQNKEIQNKRIKSFKENIDQWRNSFNKTSNERFGFNYPWQNIEKKLGVSHYKQDTIMFEQSFNKCFEFKDYELPSGKITRVQGYEPQALNKLFEMGYDESDIMIENKDIERYIGKIIYNTSDGKEHRYYPDIYIVSENKIIEVKSVYTYNKNKEVNEMKRKACLDAGLNFEFDIIEL